MNNDRLRKCIADVDIALSDLSYYLRRLRQAPGDDLGWMGYVEQSAHEATQAFEAFKQALATTVVLEHTKGILLELTKRSEELPPCP